MPAIPQILKVAFFTLEVESGDPEDFTLDAIDIAIVPSPGAVQTVKTLDGVTHQDAESESWSLDVRCVIDWDTSRPGLASYLFTNKGLNATFVVGWNTATVGATNPRVTGSCTLVPIQYGGPGNTFAEATVSLPIDGLPATDIIP